MFYAFSSRGLLNWISPLLFMIMRVSNSTPPPQIFTNKGWGSVSDRFVSCRRLNLTRISLLLTQCRTRWTFICPFKNKTSQRYLYCSLKEFVGGKTCRPVSPRHNAKPPESKILILFLLLSLPSYLNNGPRFLRRPAHLKAVCFHKDIMP